VILLRKFIFIILCILAMQAYAQPYYALNRARQVGAGCYQLNPDSINTYGCVWSLTKMDLSQPFDRTFVVNLGSKDGNGADGISFTMQNSSAGYNAYGTTGSFMAYDGISPSLNFEIDTWDNSSNGYPDIAADHLAINKDGSVFNVVSGAVPASNSGRNIEDGQCHKFRIKWVPSTYNINVFFDDTLRINKTYDIIDSVFGGATQVIWGFTGASGSLSNRQSFCDVFADAGQDMYMCPFDSVVLSAAQAFSYQWTPTTGLSCPTCRVTKAYPAVTTNYVLKATSFFGCVAYDTVKITLYNGPTTNAGADITLCQGDSIQLNITGATDVTFNTKKYLSDSTITNPWVKPTSSITYIITGTNITGCFKNDTLNIIVTSAPIANAGLDTFVCTGGNVRLQAGGGANYLWSPVTGLSATNISNPLAFPTATTTYKVIVSNGSCKDSDTVTVFVQQPPNTFAGNDFTLCQGDSAQLNATGASSYRWNNKLYLSDSTIANPWVRPLFPTTFIVTGTTAFGCSKSDTLTINVIPKAHVTTGPDTGFCRGGSVQLKAIPTGTTTLSWYPNYKINALNIFNPTVNPDVDTTYYVVASNGFCSDTAHVHVSVWEYPTANAGTDITLCEGDSTQLNGSGNGNYLWQPASGLSATSISNPYAKPIVTTDYILAVASIHSCISYDTVRVNVTKRYNVVANPDDTICPGFSKTLNAITLAPQVLWSTGDTTFSIIVSPKSTTTYWVKAINNGCVGNADSVTIFADTALHAIFIPTPDNGDVPLDVLFNNLSRGALTNNWDFGDGTLSTLHSPQNIYGTEGNYRATLTVKNARGCIDTASVLIIVRNGFKIIIPNVFTPNGDGLNDTYEIFVTGIKEYNLNIFNRWGQIVFTSNDAYKQWDGSASGNQAPDGEYYYTLVIIDFLKEQHTYKGIVTLIR
jgi:gliding motility-associated-like protein